MVVIPTEVEGSAVALPFAKFGYVRLASGNQAQSDFEAERIPQRDSLSVALLSLIGQEVINSFEQVRIILRALTGTF